MEGGWEAVDWIRLAQNRNLWWALVNMTMTFGFHYRRVIS